MVLNLLLVKIVLCPLLEHIARHEWVAKINLRQPNWPNLEYTSRNSNFEAVLTGILTTLDERPTTNVHETSDNCQVESLDWYLWYS